jgi:Flp pilus assembly pilin Flp
MAVISVDIDALTTAKGQLTTLTTEVEGFQSSVNTLWTNLTNALAGSTVSQVSDFDTHVSGASSALDSLNTALTSLDLIVANVIAAANNAAAAL